MLLHLKINLLTMPFNRFFSFCNLRFHFMVQRTRKTKIAGEKNFIRSRRNSLELQQHRGKLLIRSLTKWYNNCKIHLGEDDDLIFSRTFGTLASTSLKGTFITCCCTSACCNNAMYLMIFIYLFDAFPKYIAAA